MSDLLRRLKGVKCNPCWKRGHRCQAQMFVELDEEFEGVTMRQVVAMCLRCADGEACIRELLHDEGIDRVYGETPDACVIPEPTAEDREFAMHARLNEKPILVGETVRFMNGEREAVRKLNRAAKPKKGKLRGEGAIRNVEGRRIRTHIKLAERSKESTPCVRVKWNPEVRKQAIADMEVMNDRQIAAKYSETELRVRNLRANLMANGHQGLSLRGVKEKQSLLLQ